MEMSEPAGAGTPLGVTMSDVARVANVSRATVSRVLSGSDLVVDSTRAKVLEAVNRLGYLPNTAAQQLARNTSNVIGLLLREPRIPAYGLLHSTLQVAIDESGFQLTTVTPGPEATPEMEAARLQQLLGLRVAGLLVASGTVSPHLLRPFRSVVPLVSVGRPEQEEGINAVSYDENAHGEMIAEAVAGYGHRDVAVVMQQRKARSISEYLRSSATSRRLRELGVTVTQITSPGAEEADVHEHRARALVPLIRDRRVSAICFPTDFGMFAFVDRVHGSGISIPEDVSVIGCDGILPGIEHMGWATLRIPVEKVARRAVAVMTGLLESSAQLAPVKERHTGELVPGRSLTAPTR